VVVVLWDEFSEWGRKISEWASDYHQKLRTLPVRAQTAPGAIKAQLPESPPEAGEDMDTIMGDFERIVMPGMTHWQHPRFFAYFPANAAPPSMLAEMLVSTIAAQCMLWQTSPAATEMEQVMVDWLRQALGISSGYTGVIQDSASSATLSAVLTMRERATGFTGNAQGLSEHGKIRIYCSDQVHSSIDRACWIAGIGQANLVKIPTQGSLHGLDGVALRRAISNDRKDGFHPAGIIAVTGGTSIGASDDLEMIAAIAKDENLYTHVDAAWAGAAMICPELRRGLWEGVSDFDSIVFNPHKWLGAQFDCSVQFLKNAQVQIDTLKIQPEYLATSQDEVTNFSEWTIPLGRRFRALKLWFLIRSYGLEGLRTRLRNHVVWAQELCEHIRQTPGFFITSEPVLSLFSFRCEGDDSTQQRLVDAINDDGRIYLTQSIWQDQKVIRFQVGQFDCTEEDVMLAHAVIKEVYARMA
jgi:aromatic-L-amino-acid decarboxylase